MASAVYIFNDDYVRLTTQEFSHASHLQKGGSLFGQWTSTGNPVVHFAMSYSASDSYRNKMGQDLYDRYRICYIGEWRPVRSDPREIVSRREITKYEDAPARFLVLNVSKATIFPILFEQHTPKGIENLERLPGKNPFNKSGLFERPEPARNTNPIRYPDQSAAAAQSFWPQAREAAAPQPQAAITKTVQWYSSEEGNERLKKVLEAFKKVALQSKVDMSRDTITQDISLSFTDNRRGRKWEVKFSATFPYGGAVLIESPGTSRQNERPQKGSESASSVVNEIKKWII